jgi:exopolysaccharide production protein ExoQ
MLLFGLDKLFRPLNIGRFYSLFIFFIILVLLVSALFFVPNVNAIFFNFMGKDATFTGRMELWQAVFDHAKKSLFTGCGFAGFWVVGNRPVMDLYDLFIWLPNEAHQGYLEILNETGLVGLGLFISLVVFYAAHLPRLKRPHVWKWFVLLVLIINFFESTLFVLNNLTGVLFTFSYLALFAEIYRERANERELLCYP